MKSGEFEFGDRIQLQDEKGRMISFTLAPGEVFHTHKGFLKHDEIAGREDGAILVTSSGMKFQAFKPLLSDYVLGMKRGATIIYPKDLALIIGFGDIRPGMKVVEAGAGSGALSIALLNAITDSGTLTSFELREDFLPIAEKNVTDFFGRKPSNWKILAGNFSEARDRLTERVDRVVLDMLAPWEQIEIASQILNPGGVLIVYVATTTQLSRTAERIKEIGTFSEPMSFETLLRPWHHEGLAVRPEHSMNAHTGFLTIARRVGRDGVLPRRRRPAKGAYSTDL
ncbi:MAG: tRNA (adenine-N1)-methyltransferase [Candidatus Nanopelagicaceae bacterium]